LWWLGKKIGVNTPIGSEKEKWDLPCLGLFTTGEETWPSWVSSKDWAKKMGEKVTGEVGTSLAAQEGEKRGGYLVWGCIGAKRIQELHRGRRRISPLRKFRPAWKEEEVLAIRARKCTFFDGFSTPGKGKRGADYMPS